MGSGEAVPKNIEMVVLFMPLHAWDYSLHNLNLGKIFHFRGEPRMPLL